MKGKKRFRTGGNKLQPVKYNEDGGCMGCITVVGLWLYRLASKPQTWRRNLECRSHCASTAAPCYEHLLRFNKITSPPQLDITKNEETRTLFGDMILSVKSIRSSTTTPDQMQPTVRGAALSFVTSELLRTMGEACAARSSMLRCLL